MYVDTRPGREGVRWASWHNHTGDGPRYSYCCDTDLDVEVYRRALTTGPYAAFAITDHAFSLALPHDVPFWPNQWFYTPEVFEQHAAFRDDKIGQYLERSRALCDGEGIVSGFEVEVAHDGSTCAPPALWSSVDFVIGSVHFVPDRVYRPFESYLSVLDMVLALPIDLLAHPFRILAEIGPVAAEMVDEVLARVAAAGVAVEINAHTPFDGDPTVLAKAVALGIPVSFGLDAHHAAELANHTYFADVVARSGVTLAPDRLFDPRSLVRPA